VVEGINFIVLEWCGLGVAGWSTIGCAMIVWWWRAGLGRDLLNYATLGCDMLGYSVIGWSGLDDINNDSDWTELGCMYWAVTGWCGLWLNGLWSTGLCCDDLSCDRLEYDWLGCDLLGCYRLVCGVLGFDQLGCDIMGCYVGLWWAGLCTIRRKCVKHGPRQLAPEGRQRPSFGQP
jgi:hypothetical protein